MSLSSEHKATIVAEHGSTPHDTGSTPVQIAILTDRIKELTEHAKRHPHDHHSKRGLLKLVGQRKRLMKYMNKHDHAEYRALIQKLGIRG